VPLFRNGRMHKSPMSMENGLGETGGSGGEINCGKVVVCQLYSRGLA
jgi:hypothetical protein